jgi:hypothetical protein
MRIVRAASLAILVILTMVGSGWADSVSQSDAVAAFNATSGDIAQNWKAYESNKILQNEFQAGKNAYTAGLLAAAFGFKTQAQNDFKIAISDFNQVSNGLSSRVPDAGSLSLLGCTGLMLFGALKKKFSR